MEIVLSDMTMERVFSQSLVATLGWAAFTLLITSTSHHRCLQKEIAKAKAESS